MKKLQYLLLCLILLLFSALATAAEDQGDEEDEPASIPLTLPASEPTVFTPNPFPYVFSVEGLLAVPQPLLVGGVARLKKLPQLEAYFDTGYFQYPFWTSGSFKISEASFELGARYFPTQSWWGFSLGIGYRNIQFTTTQLGTFNVNGVILATSGNITLSTLYFSPMMEARIHLSERATLGFGLGLQIAVSAAGPLTFQNANNGFNSDTSSSLQVDTSSYLNRVAALLVPRLTLLRFSWNL